MQFDNNFKLIKLNNSIIPSIPFLWYREEQLVCPIDFIGKYKMDNLKKLDNENLDMFDDNEFIYVIIQRDILSDSNIYLCLHSFLFYNLNKDNENNILVIPDNFFRNIIFDVKTIQLAIENKIIEIRCGLKINEFTKGSVFIHNSSFSPVGCLHFKVHKNTKKNVLFCEIKCNEINVNIKCLFVLMNDLNGTLENDIIDKILKEINYDK